MFIPLHHLLTFSSMYELVSGGDDGGGSSKTVSVEEDTLLHTLLDGVKESGKR